MNVNKNTQLTQQEIEAVKFKTALAYYDLELFGIEGTGKNKVQNCDDLLGVARTSDEKTEARVKNTMNLVESVIKGESTSIDARTVAVEIDSIAEFACYELAFIHGLVNIFNKSDRATKESFMIVKNTILRACAMQRQEIQPLLSEHIKALEGIVQPTSYAKYAAILAFLALLIAFFAFKMV